MILEGIFVSFINLLKVIKLKIIFFIFNPFKGLVFAHPFIVAIRILVDAI